MSKRAFLVSLIGLLALSQIVYPQNNTGRFKDAHDEPIKGWTGPVFKLSQDYPATPPAKENPPWLKFDFKTQPAEYIQSALSYALEGNVEVDWQVEKNKVRSWYHAPWMHAGDNGREFVHGLTRERNSRAGELHPQQKGRVQNWAVSVYNAPGGYIIGQVWKDASSPDATAANFPDGTLSIKLLFTKTTVEEVPYLKGAKEWQAHINKATGSSNEREIQTVRLLQIDLAVRDVRAKDTTGWIFGTFVYDGDAPGDAPYDRMVPVGIMWGNDPGITPKMVNEGTELSETWINPDVGPPQHLGWAGRLNGPVDNPESSCLSCHATAQFPQGQMTPPNNAPDDQRLNWFRNIKAGESFSRDAVHRSLDYSLQLSFGIRNFMAEKGELVRAQIGPKTMLFTQDGVRVFPVNRDGSDEEVSTPSAGPLVGAKEDQKGGPLLDWNTVLAFLAGGALGGAGGTLASRLRRTGPGPEQ